MNVKCLKYNRSRKDDNCIEIDIEVSSPFSSNENDNIKIFINELFEQVKAFYRAKTANKSLVYNSILLQTAQLLSPLGLYGSFQLYRHFNKNKFRGGNMKFNNKMLVRLSSFGKSLFLLVPAMVLSGALTQYAARVPLMIIGDNIMRSNPQQGNEVFMNYLRFREQLSGYKYSH